LRWRRKKLAEGEMVAQASQAAEKRAKFHTQGLA
jgi:hypothetical protein